MKKKIKIQFRRRKECKTDYAARERALLGEMPRLAVRKTNRYLIAQVIESKNAQDKVLLTVNSKELFNYGFPAAYSAKNMAAAYLTGFLCALKANKKRIEKAIFDIGLIKSTKGNRVYSLLKGAIDGGLKISHSKEILPGLERIKSAKTDINKIKEEIKKKW